MRTQQSTCARAIAAWSFGVAVLLAVTVASAGEPLVSKSAEGKFLPASASEWTQASPTSMRFVLRSGLDANQVAGQLKDKVAPLTVRATDDMTLLFEGEGLAMEALLEKLAGIPLEADAGLKDALAALSDPGLGQGGPSLSDLSSGGSIRASKKIDLPGGAQADPNPQQVIGKVMRVGKGRFLPFLVIEVTRAATEGPHKGAFRKGYWYAIRGSFKLSADGKTLDESDPKTQLNIKTRQIKKGMLVSGTPVEKQGKIWTWDTIEPVQPATKP